MLLVTAEEMRALDRATIEEFGTPGYELMERAGGGATDVLFELLPHMRGRGSRVVICAGPGNNGGDGFVMARRLRRTGVIVSVALIGRAEDLQGDALRAFKSWRGGRTALHEITSSEEVAHFAEWLEGAGCVVDAIFGTGLKRPVEGVYREVIELINGCGSPIFAVDIPSGLDADRGQPLGIAVRATATATFGFAKIGQLLYPGVEYCGRLAVVDIGLAEQAIAARPPRTALSTVADVASLVPRRRVDAHKGDAGHVLVLAGSRGKTGAAILAAQAAARSGAGLVTIAGPASLNPIYCGGFPEAMTAELPDRDGRVGFDAGALRALCAGKSALVVGPGLGTHDEVRRIVEWMLAEADAPLLLDADALTVLAKDVAVLRTARPQTLLTPHPGEMGRLIGTDSATVQADRVGTARRFAAEYGCTLVLKGARSVVAGAEGLVWINPTGNPGMASGGMGDVLGGILGALLAQGLSSESAARLGVYVHGYVGDQVARDGEIGMLASDIITGLPTGLRDLREREEP
jgi:NAD(P)H-hydrate epimerase